MVNRGAAVMDGRVYRGNERLDMCGPMTRKPAGVSGPRRSRILRRARRCPRRLSRGTASSSSATQAATTKASRVGCMRLTPTRERSFGNSIVPRGPEDIARGPEGKIAPGLLAASWNNAKGFPISGGATCTSYTLDPASELLYVPAGNPAPDFVNAYRSGETYLPARSSCSMQSPEPINAISRSCVTIFTTGTNRQRPYCSRRARANA